MSDEFEREPEAPNPENPGPEKLDGGLREAFGKKRPVPGASVLQAIEALSGAVPRVLLRAANEEDTPVVKPGGSTDGTVNGRYQIVGELARGGVGVILKARDVDLGRDVAMKVLLPGHVGNDELLQRFVEEAQIGGQLQHPGIVPVYELGLQADKRPYFSMKLVKGRTLSALLSDRDDVRHERGRYLSIFHQVCQTLAYAHSRGVVHRDLKPANIMVGAFGEVQVVDWGFAKVLSSGGVADERKARAAEDLSVIATVRSESEGSASMAGSVMGTPAYMPPEQALGEVDNLDERSDVFSLGAILCEILTGEPPYTKRGGSLLVQAAKGELQDVFDRLDACGADPEIVGLAKRCLSTQRARRPRDATAIAATVGDYLASIDARAREAEMNAATSRTRSKWSAALAAVVLLAGGVIWWADSERQARITQASRVASESIEDAMLLFGQARSASTEDLTGWLAARKLAERALARTEGADDATRTRARTLVENVGREEQAAQAAAKTARTDREMVNRLTEIRTSSEEVLEAADKPDAYAVAFESYGLDVERIRTSAIRDELIGALDDWRGAPAVLRGVDSDTWRNEVRAIARDDGAALEARAKTDVIEDLPLLSLLLLGDRLGHAGQIDSAIRVYRTAAGRFPDSFWSYAGLAGWSAESSDSETVNTSVRHLAAALALRPGALALRYDLSKALMRERDLERALVEMQKLHDRAPEFPGVRSQLAKLYREKGKAFSAHRAYLSSGRAYARSIEFDPSDAWTLSSLSNSLWNTGAKQRAIKAMRASLELNEENWYGHWRLGVYLGDTQVDQAEAVAELRRAKELMSSDRERVITNRDLAKVLEKSGDLSGAIEGYMEVIRLSEMGFGLRFEIDRFAQLREKQGGVAAAIAFLQKAVQENPEEDWLYEDLCEYLVRDGQESEAESVIIKRRELLGELIAKATAKDRNFLNLRLGYDLAHTPLVRLRKPADALSTVRKGLKLNAEGQPSQHDRVWFLGPVLYRNGKYTEALKAFEDTGRFGEHVHAHMFVALSHKALGNAKEARVAWSKADAAPHTFSIWQHTLEEARAIMEAPG